MGVCFFRNSNHAVLLGRPVVILIWLAVTTPTNSQDADL